MTEKTSLREFTKWLEESELVEIVGDEDPIEGRLDGVTINPRGTARGVEAYFRKQLSLLVPEDGLVQKQSSDAYKVSSDNQPVIPSHGYQHAIVRRLK